MLESLKTKTVNGVFWSSVERFSVQAIQFTISLLIARVLTPADYGVIGMLAIFMALSQTFIDSGFSNALIRKTNRTEVDNSTVFYFNIAVGLLFYALLYFAAPAIAQFYDTPILIPITRVLALGIIFNSLAIVQRALLTIRVDFKTQAKASLTAALLSGAVGLWMAYSGFGIWALAVQTILNGFLNTVMLWVLTQWRPLWVFSWSSFRELFSFGSKLLASGLIDTIYNNVYTIVIGKIFSAGELGYYSKAKEFSQIPSSNIQGIVGRVTYPILCELQDDDERLRQVYRRYLRLSAYLTFPLMIGLAALASPLITVLLTDKWVAAVLLLQILCFAMMWYPIHAINLNLLQVKGRTDLFLRLEILKKIVGVSILCVTIPLGVAWMCVGSVVSSIVCLAINTHYTGVLIQLGFLKQMRDLLPALFYSLSMGALVYLVMEFVDGNLLKLGVGTLVGVLYYVGISLATRSAEFKDVFSLIRKK
ncbi:MAG: lipopolysaccharide biosynthesis protein [Alistipes sp.]